LALGAAVGASSELPGSPATNVIDGGDAHWNAGGVAPQSIELRLAHAATIEEIRLRVAQDPAGASVHELWIGRTGGQVSMAIRFEGVTADGDVLIYRPDAPLTDVELVRVDTTDLGGLFPAWREIEVWGR
jgi:hypothetical protein